MKIIIFKVSIEKQTYRSQECLTVRKNSKNYGKTLANMANRLDGHLFDYQVFFKNKTKKFFDKAEKYTYGLFTSNNRNIERICESLPETGYHQMQHFISDSNWNAHALINKVAQDTSRLLPTRKLTGLIIDETGIAKKGDKSVGVGWQYCGNVGKVSNSQVAVMACLSNGDFASMVDARLFLPKSWCNSHARCEGAKIPKEERVFKTKTELAYDIVINQLELGIGFDFVGADGFYGNDPELTDKLNDLGCLYMLDIHSNQQIFLEEPELVLPERKSKRGRPSKIQKPDVPSVRADRYCHDLCAEDWKEIKVRNTAKGTLKGKYHFCNVYVYNKTRNTFENRLLVIRKVKTKNGVEIKYSFTNANLAQYTEKGIAYMQAQRFFVEHCIKECKQVLGMDQFQTRKWQAWHHQIALNLMVACFILKEKLANFWEIPLLSAADIKEWICFKLYKKLTDNEMIILMSARHVKRQTDINRYYRIKNLNVLK